MLLCGLWWSKEKPTMNMFMKPLVDQANELYQKGEIVYTLRHYNNIFRITENETIKVAIVAMSCDLPARAMVLNMKQFNGRSGCHLCEDEGATSESNRLFRWWPFSSSPMLRTRESLISNAVYASTHNEAVSCNLIATLCIYICI